jgi:hypothetical protein
MVRPAAVIKIVFCTTSVSARNRTEVTRIECRHSSSSMTSGNDPTRRVIRVGISYRSVRGGSAEVGRPYPDRRRGLRPRQHHQSIDPQVQAAAVARLVAPAGRQTREIEVADPP